MQLSELVTLLGKVNQIAGDVPVVLSALEGDVERVLIGVGIHLPAQQGLPTTVTLDHSSPENVPKPPDPTPGDVPAA